MWKGLRTRRTVRFVWSHSFRRLVSMLVLWRKMRLKGADLMLLLRHEISRARLRGPCDRLGTCLLLSLTCWRLQPGSAVLERLKIYLS